MWAVWGMLIVVVLAILSSFAFGVWFIAIPLSLVAIGLALAARGSGRLGDSGQLRRFRSKAGDAAPDTDTLAE